MSYRYETGEAAGRRHCRKCGVRTYGAHCLACRLMDLAERLQVRAEMPILLRASSAECNREWLNLWMVKVGWR